ncbi:MAG: TonB family protein [Trinickia sp.]|uniref:TonB family protein n=1 Tax=Trinickia sp. TaxID=2571163 RepID=UPI003F80F61F
MSSGWQRLSTAADAPKVRLAVACVVATIAWAGVLAHFARLFAQDDRPRPVPETIDMKLVEITPRVPAARIAARAQSEPMRHAVSERRSRAAQPLVRHEAVKPTQRQSAQQRSAPPPRVEPSAEPAREAPSADGGAVQPESVRPSAADASPASSSVGAAQARLLSQPLPLLPDDLREDAYRAEAVARFAIHADGTTEVRLVKPTSNPRLNQILLEALHKWRFFPAMENGHPVDSQRDVRVHFNVS